MSDTHTDETARSTALHDAIYDLMRELYQENPGNMRKVMRKWCGIVLDDPDMCNSALELAAVYVYNGVLPRPKRSRRNRDEMEEHSRKQIKRSIFKLMMPNGKPLGKCTGSEVAKCGKGFEKLSRMIGPNEIVEEKLTQAQARKAVLG